MATILEDIATMFDVDFDDDISELEIDTENENLKVTEYPDNDKTKKMRP